MNKKPSELFEGENSSLYKTFMNTQTHMENSPKQNLTEKR